MKGDVDAILLQGAYDHERLAEAILDEYYAPLHYLAYSILGDAPAADDVVQDALIRALDLISRYEPGTNLRAWLSAIVVNKCRDRLRRRDVRRRLERGLKKLAGGRSGERSPERRLARDEARSALWSAVDALNTRHRLPIILRYVHGMRPRDIAALLRLREGTVHSRLHNACRQLGRQLAIDDHKEMMAMLFDE